MTCYAENNDINYITEKRYGCGQNERGAWSKSVLL